MRVITGMILLLLASVALSENWVTLKTPADPMGGTPPISSVDTESIEILNSGVRQARVKIDFSSLAIDASESPNGLMFLIAVEVYDCDKRSTRFSSTEAHLRDGTVKRSQSSNTNWLKSEIEVDPTISFVCAWVTKAARLK
jgi:hypothetical protein